MKRDRLLAFMTRLPGIGVTLPFIIYFVVLWGLFFRWSLLPLVLRGSLGIIFSLLFFLKGVRPLTKMGTWKRWNRVERLRMNQKEALLCAIQPEADLDRLSLPVVLTARLSSLVYFSFAVFWLASFGITFLLWNALGEMGNPGSVFPLWLASGGIIIGLTGILMYQRIEVTELALIVQRGLKRRTLRWGEAKLFASVRLLDEEEAPVHYELSSEKVLLRWLASAPGFGLISYPKEKEEYEQLLNNLLAYIRARTDLPLLKLN